MAHVLRHCVVCGKQMSTQRNTKKTCSHACRQKLYVTRKQEEEQCELR